MSGIFGPTINSRRAAANSGGAGSGTARGIVSTVVSSAGHLIVTYSDGTTTDAGIVTGAQGVAGVAGRGVASTAVNGSGHLIVTYSDGTTADLGVVVGATGATGSTGSTGAAGRGIASTAVNGSGHLIVTYTDASTQDVGLVVGRGVASTAINASGHLITTFTDGSTQDDGVAVGPQGITPWSPVAVWTYGTPYSAGPPASVVTHAGACFVFNPAHAGVTLISGTPPENDPTYWLEVAAPGATGVAGRGVSNISYDNAGDVTITYSDATTQTLVANPYAGIVSTWGVIK